MNKKYLLGLAVMVIIFFGLYYLSTSNKLSPNLTPDSQRNINSSAPQIKTNSGLFISVGNGQIIVKNPQGVEEVYQLTDQTVYKKVPHPRLQQEGVSSRELIIEIGDLKVNDKLAIDTEDGKTAQAIFVMSENPNDFNQ